MGFDGEDPYDEGEDPVNGCKMYDVGWMKIGVECGLVNLNYTWLRDSADWGREYRRPPDTLRI